MNYTPEELDQLHDVLYEILAEIVRVCEECDIPYFIQGGTAIGAFFEGAILPWDDDIDIGMTRPDYERFLREAPSRLRPGFFLQWDRTDRYTPFYFAKVRKDNTLFLEEKFASLPMHHGIYVDVFPFDKVPDNPRLQNIHRIACNFLNCCFMGKQIWLWKHCGEPQVKDPSDRPFLPCLFTRVFCAVFTKHALLNMLSALQGCFNRRKTTYYNMVLMPKDHISVESIEHPQRVKFGRLTVWAPSDLETYLRHHYPNLRRHIPKEEQQNHRPLSLLFDIQSTKRVSIG